jgi:hypothetical protein
VSSGIRIALWTVSSENPNSPVLNGIVTIDGVDHKVSLWDNSEAEHPRAPRFKGKTSRPSPKDDVDVNETTEQDILVPVSQDKPWYMPF